MGNVGKGCPNDRIMYCTVLRLVGFCKKNKNKKTTHYQPLFYLMLCINTPNPFGFHKKSLSQKINIEKKQKKQNKKSYDPRI